MMYENYHAHTHYSNIYTPDCIIKPEDLAKRAVELGQKTLCSLEHGYVGNLFENYDIAKKYNLKLIVGAEFYFVPDRKEQNPANYHMVILAKNNDGIKEIKKIMSIANHDGFYYKPRIDLELLLNINPNNVIITTACLGSFIRESDQMFVFKILRQLQDHFKDNLFLEIQCHTNEKQVVYNEKIKYLHNVFKIPLIHGCDTHYININDGKDRDIFIRGKGIEYPDEQGFLMDYPDIDEIKKRYKEQGVFDENDINNALENTNILLTFEDVIMTKEIKMPSIFNDMTIEQKLDSLKEIIYKEFDKQYPIGSLSDEKRKEYKEEIKLEYNIIKATSEVKTVDYFLLNYQIIKRAVNKYGGVLTRTGRGSAPSFLINKLLGFTNIDRIASPVKLYPTRFMSISRILEAKSLPDIDFNVADPKPFVKASQDLLGENGVVGMIAYGTFKEGAAFRNLCRSRGLDFDEYNEVAKELDKYRSNPKWKDIINETQKFVGVIDSMALHPCHTKGHKILTKNGLKNIEDITCDDYVLTHKNIYQKVVKTMKNNSNDIYELTFQGGKNYVTGNHPYYVREMSKDIYKKRKFNNPIWKQVNELNKNYYLGTPINNNSIKYYYKSLPTDNENFWWFVGRFLGDGWLKKYEKKRHEYVTMLCCGYHEFNEIINILSKLPFKYNYRKRKTVFEFNISLKDLYDFLLQFNKGASNKIIPNFVLDLPNNLLKSFIYGYESADGNISGKRHRVSSVSKNLIYMYAHCVYKIYNVNVSINEKKGSYSIIDGRKVLCKNSYHLSYTIDRFRPQGFYENGYIWSPIRSIIKTNKEELVYNFEVENDNSYLVNNMIVHNCAYVLLSKPIDEELGIIKAQDNYVCLIDSTTADGWKYLKNDYLTVTVWDIISKVYKMINKPIDTIQELTDKLDDKTWAMYEKGLTATLNQTNSDFATPKVVQYKPKSVSELSAFVAAIRPGFGSMVDVFLNREPFSYKIDVFDKLLSDSQNFVLYQENVMTVLQFAGFPGDETYSLLKAIAKKKPGIIEPIEERFKKGFGEKLGNVKNKDKVVQKVWQIVVDNVGYSFNSSHSLATALDSLYGAYLKSHYPLEYYTVVLNIYKDNKDETKKIISELGHFNIKLEPIRFGYSTNEYKCDKETNSIYKGVASIKYLNNKVSQELYDLGQKEYQTFTDLYKEIFYNSSCDARQLEILIKSDFFYKFGTIGKLLNLLNEYKNGKNRLTKGLIEKTVEKRLLELKEYEINLKNYDEFNEFDLIRFKIENSLVVDVLDNYDKRTFIITEIDSKYKNLKLTLYQIATGETIVAKIKAKSINVLPIVNKFDVIRITRLTLENQWYNKDGKWLQYNDEDNRKEYVIYGLQIMNTKGE